MSTSPPSARSNERRFPESLVLIFALIVIAQLASYVLPKGEFERVAIDGKLRVVPGTFHAIEDAAPLPWHAALTSIPRGFGKGSDIVFFVFLVGGVIGVVRATGALDALVSASLRAFGGRPIYLIAGATSVLALGASAIGMSEEYLPFVPILVAMCLALGLDAVVAVAIANVGAAVGYAAAALNPFTVLIAQSIAGVPPTSGSGFRYVLLAVVLAVAVHHIASYARRVKRDPAASLVRDVDYSDLPRGANAVELTTRRVLVIAVFVAGIALFVIGVNSWGWYMTELGAVFLGIALAAAAIGALHPNRVAREFTAGAAEMTNTALLIGFAYTIQVVLDDARVIDGIVQGIAAPIAGFGAEVAAVAMLGVQSAIGLVIASGSGQAYVTMPIMTKLADVTGVSQQTGVLAYQLADGLMNMVVPTSGVLMGMLGLARIPFTRWLRFVLPLLAKLMVVAIGAVLIAVWIDYR